MREFSIINEDARPETRWPILPRIALLLGFWLFVGFGVGTLFLLFPVRWWATLSRQNAWGEGIEKGGVVIIIVALVTITFAIANGLMTAFVRTRHALVRVLLVAAALGAAGTAYWKWINPDTMKGSMAAEQSAGAHFTFGPFPDAQRLVALKAEGYTGVITLLHPAVVPFEPQLLAQEKKDAAAAGIELIHLPMLPWVSDNADSIDKLRAIAASKKGRYYIHCYLGADRVNVARRIIEQESGGTAVFEGAGEASRRSIEEKKRFERGPIYKLEEGLYLTPYPTDEEFVGFVLGGQVKNIIALLDPKDDGQKKRIDHERELLKTYSLPFHLVEVSSSRYGGRRILDALEMAKKLERPVMIHSFFTPGTRPAPVAEAVLMAYRSGLPPLPPSLWTPGVAGGKAEVIAPHVATGPAPAPGEYYEVLHARGVRAVMVVGDPGASAPAEAAEAGIEWTSLPADPAAALEAVKSGGPYYIFGPGAAKVTKAIRDHYAPMMELPKPLGDAPEAATR